MNLTSTTTNTTTQIKPADPKNETPPQIQPIKSLSFTNGTLKNHHHHQQLTAAPPAAAVKYKECLKNHAASLGGHALDGCGEFMPSPTATPNDPTSLKCAACGCHRNFHRRDPDEPTAALFLDFRPHPPPPPPPPPRRTSFSPSTSPPRPSPYYTSPNMLLALSTAVTEDHPTTTHRQFTTPATVKTENPIGRKRFRSKFSQIQKEEMFSFSEKLGWKMQKCDEALVEKFCNEIGVRKGVLKVWMHNNKHNFVKRSDINISNGHNNNSLDDHQIEDSGVHLNGSSSSSRSVERESEGERDKGN